VKATEATYRLLDGLSLVVWHYGDEITLSVDEAVTRPIPPVRGRFFWGEPPAKDLDP